MIDGFIHAEVRDGKGTAGVFFWFQSTSAGYK